MSLKTTTDKDLDSVALAMSCKILDKAFHDSGSATCCKHRSLPTLLEAKVTQDYKHNNRRFMLLELQTCKTQRLVKWLESGYVSMADFWNIGQARMIHKERPVIPGFWLTLTIVFKEKFREGCILGKKETHFMKDRVKELQHSVGMVWLVAWHDSCNEEDRVMLSPHWTLQ